MLKQARKAPPENSISGSAPAGPLRLCPKLEQLRAKLKHVAAQLDSEERFLFHTRTDAPARLWIDCQAKLEPAGRAGTYRFLCYARRGWMVLLETDRFDLLEQLSERYVLARSTGCALLEIALAAEG